MRHNDDDRAVWLVSWTRMHASRMKYMKGGVQTHVSNCDGQ